jgi:hypothetical protein
MVVKLSELKSALKSVLKLGVGERKRAEDVTQND